MITSGRNRRYKKKGGRRERIASQTGAVPLKYASWEREAAAWGCNVSLEGVF
jgi:hypothetical protein